MHYLLLQYVLKKIKIVKIELLNVIVITVKLNITLENLEHLKMNSM